MAETYHAHFVRPGKAYDVDVRPGRGESTITQTRAGVWSLIRDLHGSAVVYPESALASTWRWYTELCTFVVVAAGVSGVYLWVVGRRERRIGLVVLAAAAAVSRWVDAPGDVCRVGSEGLAHVPRRPKSSPVLRAGHPGVPDDVFRQRLHDGAPPVVPGRVAAADDADCRASKRPATCRPSSSRRRCRNN